MDELQELYSELILEFAKYSNKMTKEEREELAEALNLIEKRAGEKGITLTMPKNNYGYTWDDGGNTNVTTIAQVDPTSYSTSVGIEQPRTERRIVSTMHITVHCVRNGLGDWVQQENKPTINEYNLENKPNVIYEDYMEVSVYEEYYDADSNSVKSREGKYEVPCNEITEKAMNQYEKNEAQYKRQYPAAYWTIKIMRWNPVFVIADNIGNDRDILTQRKRSWTERATNIAVAVADIVTLGEGKVVVTLLYFGGKAVETGTEGTQYENLGKLASTGMSLSSAQNKLHTVLEKPLSLEISKEAAKIWQDLGALTGTALELKLKEYKNSGQISEADYTAMCNGIQLLGGMIP